MPDCEQNRTKRWADQLIDSDVTSQDPSVANAEVFLLHEHRQQRAAGGVGKNLGEPETEDGHQHDHDGGLAGRHKNGQSGDQNSPQQINSHDQHSPVEPVGQRAGVQPKEQPRKLLQQRGKRHEERIAGERGDKERTGGEADPISKIGNPR